MTALRWFVRIGIALACVGALGCASSRRSADDAAAIIAAAHATDATGQQLAALPAQARQDERVRQAYALGQLQATKSLHAALQQLQNTDQPGARGPESTLVPLTIPERIVDGVIINRTEEYVRLPR